MGFVTGLENATVFKINNRKFRHDFNLGQWIQAAWAQAKFFQQGSPIVIEEVTGDCIIVKGNPDKPFNYTTSPYLITNSSLLTTETWNNAYAYGHIFDKNNYANIMILNDKIFSEQYSLVYKVTSGNELRFLYYKSNKFNNSNRNRHPAIPVYDSETIKTFTQDEKDYIYEIMTQEFDKISGSIYNSRHAICVKIKFSTSEGYMMDGWLKLGSFSSSFGSSIIYNSNNRLDQCVSYYSLNWGCSQTNGSPNPLTDETDNIAFTRDIGGNNMYWAPQTFGYTYNTDANIISRNPNFIKDFLNCFNIPFADYDNRNVQTDDLKDGWLGPGEPLSPDSPNPPPYNPGGDSEQGGGTGDFDDSSFEQLLPDIIVDVAGTSNMVTVFNPSSAQLTALANKLYEPSIIDVLKQGIWTSPLEAIISLGIVPFTLNNTGTAPLKIGYTVIDVILPTASQMYKFDCGDVTINEYWGNFMDYAPYTRIELFLPFIGMINLNTDEVMGCTINITYHCDVLSGTCQVYVYNKTRKYIMNTYTGNILTTIPLSRTSYDAFVQSMAYGIAAAGVGAITGGLGNLAVSAGGAISSFKDIGALMSLAGEAEFSAGAIKGAGTALSVATVNSIMNGKPTLQRTGGISASGALMGYKKPYIILTRPQQSVPSNYGTYRGYPSNISSKLGDLKGYTEVEYVHLEGFNTATDAERTMIENQLKAGIIL